MYVDFSFTVIVGIKIRKNISTIKKARKQCLNILFGEWKYMKTANEQYKKTGNTSDKEKSIEDLKTEKDCL
jgi:hypothetical protein